VRERGGADFGVGVCARFLREGGKAERRPKERKKEKKGEPKMSCVVSCKKMLVATALHPPNDFFPEAWTKRCPAQTAEQRDELTFMQ
jgi:hypothetical protein